MDEIKDVSKEAIKSFFSGVGRKAGEEVTKEVVKKAKNNKKESK